MFENLTSNPVGLTALGYVGVASHRLDDWHEFASGLLGMQLAHNSRGTRAFRMDDRRQRILVHDGPRGFFGWEVADAAALDQVANRLDQHGIAHEPLGRLTGERFVRDGLALRDPAGNLLEIVYGPETTDEPFRPGRTISGFRTGALGLGHAVLTAPDVESLARFYTQVLGFRVSDYMYEPFKACFFHLNPRHHSLALVQAPSIGMHHLMVEMMMLDDVGQAYDIARTREKTVNVTLGRHSNDNMFSFYANTPSPFMVECGWGGRTIDPDGWQPIELADGPSLWGHERGWLDEATRAAARKIRMEAAERGSRAPVHVQEGNYDLGLNCRWFSGLKGTDAYAVSPYTASRKGLKHP
ncbi:MAG TPA: VOC family protein [Pseudonocardiaceae bacterium]